MVVTCEDRWSFGLAQFRALEVRICDSAVRVHVRTPGLPGRRVYDDSVAMGSCHLITRVSVDTIISHRPEREHKDHASDQTNQSTAKINCDFHIPFGFAMATRGGKRENLPQIQLRKMKARTATVRNAQTRHATTLNPVDFPISIFNLEDDPTIAAEFE